MVQAQYSLALHKAMSLLCRKFYSEREMRQKLEKYEYDTKTITAVIDHLKSIDYLNDYKLCKALFEKYSQNGKCGCRLTMDKMLMRGLPKTMVQEMMREFDFDNETEQALQLAQKRYDCRQFLNSSELGKIARYLSGRGFSNDAISKTIYELKNQKVCEEEE